MLKLFHNASTKIKRKQKNKNRFISVIFLANLCFGENDFQSMFIFQPTFSTIDFNLER